MGAQIAAHRGGARLVEQREALVDLAVFDEAPPLPGEREHLHVATAHPLAELVGLVEQLGGMHEVAFGEQRGERMHQLQPPVLGSLGEIGEQAFRVREPASCDGERAASLVIPTQGKRHSGGAERVAVGGVRRVRALAMRDRLFDLPAPPGRLAEAFVVGGSQDARVDVGVCGVRRAPRLFRGGRACVVERVDQLRHERLIVTTQRAVAPPACPATFSRTAGATSRPSSSIERRIPSWGIPPIVNWIMNRS